MTQGDTLELKWTLEEDDDGVITPYDLTGHTVTGSVRRDFACPDVWDFTITINDPETGVIDGVITDTSEWQDRMVFDIQWEDPNGNIRTFDYGVIVVRPEVTL